MTEPLAPPPFPVAALGSSSTEVFDYIFGDTPLYHPLWAGGWSARGLRKEEPGGFLAATVADLPRNTRILLNFGATDICFNLPHKVRAERFYDYPAFMAEIVDGISRAHDLLSQMGFTRISAIFAAPVVALPRSYWAEMDTLFLPPAQLGRMYRETARLAAQRGLPIIDLIDRFIVSHERPVLRPALTRKQPNHHASYIATQEAIWAGIRHLPDLPPPHTPFHHAHYPHQSYPLGMWRLTGQPRPRTTR